MPLSPLSRYANRRINLTLLYGKSRWSFLNDK